MDSKRALAELPDQVLLDFVVLGMFMFARPNGMHTCVYSFSQADTHFYTQPELLNMRSPPFYAWQRPLLFALLGAQLLALLALLSLSLSFHPPTRRISGFAFIGAMACAGKDYGGFKGFKTGTCH